MKYLVGILLISSVMCAYNATKARSLAFICASTFGTEAEINSWTCKYCTYNNVTNVQTLSLRVRPLTTPSLISSASPATWLLRMPLLSHSEAQSVSRTGSSTSMLPKYSPNNQGAISWMFGMRGSSRFLQRLRWS